ncbi:MAG: hypothetical protein RQ824_06625 [bacterium]|nr:hypothetical protein [bacterium]
MSENIAAKKHSFFFTEIFRPMLIILGALSILITKGYISATMLIGFTLLDYFTTNLSNKIPVPVCFAIFVALTTLAVN